MSGFSPIVNNRGRFKCPYCDHKTWKTKQPAVGHILREHKALAQLDQEKAELQRDRDNISIKLNMAQRSADIKERELQDLRAKCFAPAKEEKRYPAIVYCPNCMSVDSVNIVSGQAIGEGGCFRCGVRGGMQVKVSRVNPFGAI